MYSLKRAGRANRTDFPVSRDYLSEYRSPGITNKIISEIRNALSGPASYMEVCGTHTMSIFRNGLRDILPSDITLVSGPGCPVCVTTQREIDAFIALARLPEVSVTTFGDLIRVPGSASSLQQERSKGSDIRIVYSPTDALHYAKNHPNQQVVFLGVGFETTAPLIAATILTAKNQRVRNFSVFSAHKIIPPALERLAEMKELYLDGLLLPGHVSAVIGIEGYRSFVNHYHIPCAIAGFEPADILLAVLALIRQNNARCARTDNCYGRVVTRSGNVKAKDLLSEVFEVVDAQWRGLGMIEKSGLAIRKELSDYDAAQRFQLSIPLSSEPRGCACGQILTGSKSPPQCPLYKTVCTPMDPVGPCMVSSEGTCAAYYKYHQ